MNSDFRFDSNFQPQNSYWKKYDNLINGMSKEQQLYVGKQKYVLQAKQNLISAFIDYLFEQQKSSFVMTSDIARNLADEYLKVIQKASDNYVSHTDELEKENAELKKQLQQFLLDFGDGKNDGKTAK